MYAELWREERSISLEVVHPRVVWVDAEGHEKAGAQPEEQAELRQHLFDGFIPRRTIAFINSDNPSATAVALRQQIDSRPLVDNQTTVYLCQNFSCQKPLSNYGDIKSAFDTMKVSVSR